MKKTGAILLLLLLAATIFPYALQAPNLVTSGSAVSPRFFNDDGTPARGLAVFLSDGEIEQTLTTDNAGYIYYVAKDAATYTYKIPGGQGTLIEFEQKTLVAGEEETRAGEQGSLIQNAVKAVGEMGDVLVSSATLIVPLFVLFLILAFIAVYFILKD